VVKKIFYLGLAGLALFEFLKIYFIMPMPGSQRLAHAQFRLFPPRPAVAVQNRVCYFDRGREPAGLWNPA
jgi:hypothetical protein